MTKIINFNELCAGDVVDNQFISQGVTISAFGGSGSAMIFDTANPTGGDYDLETTNLNKVLIVSEDGDSDDPDDNASGGTLIFEFDVPSAVNQLTFLDIEESASVKFFTPDGHLIETMDICCTTDNGQLIQDFDVSSVGRMEVTLCGSGAIDNLVFEDFGLDGVVEGDACDNLIDEDYAGDPEGDVVDGGDNIFSNDPAEADDDIIEAGDGNDTVLAGEGSDVVAGGAGNDFIITGNGDFWPDRGFPNDDGTPEPGFPIGFPADPNPDNDRDSVSGGDGNDTILTGDDADTISGGAGSDIIFGGVDDDEIAGDAGADVIIGGEGSDQIDGGTGNDTLFGGNIPLPILDLLNIEDDGSHPFFPPDPRPDNGEDTIHGGDGNDFILGADDGDALYGDAGNDTIDGGIDDDVIDGGIGDDSLLGGQGNDVISGGEGGTDTASGGDDRDTFDNFGATDVVDGGEGGNDCDTLDLRDTAPTGGSLRIVRALDNPENGVVNYFDEDGDPAGTLTFSNIENIVPCFTPGTLIATPTGEKAVEHLAVGDRVITRDNGIQEIRWAGKRELSGLELEHAPHLKPVLIRAGALGNALPERDMLVSPQHRVLMATSMTSLYFDESEVLVAAKHLTDMTDIDVADVTGTTYIHVMFDQHEVILSNGSWTESFQPGTQTLSSMGKTQYAEILELFPGLETGDGIAAYGSARRSLKKYEARLLSS